MPFSPDNVAQIQSAIKMALVSTSLNQWQRTFLTDMQAKFEKYGPRTRLSGKQYAKLRETLAPFENNRPPTRSRSFSPRTTSTKSPHPTKPFKNSPSPVKAHGRKRRSISVVIWLAAALVLAVSFLGNMPETADTPTTDTRDSRSVFNSSDDFRVVDGDTVHIIGAANGTRLVGFNTPETYRPRCDRGLALGQKATNRLKELVRTSGNIELRLVRCACRPGTEGTRQCNYGRSCGVLRVDGRDVGDILISEGLAARFRCGQTSCPPTPRPWCN